MKKITFVCSETIGLSIEGKEIIDTQESYIISSLWQSRSGKYAVYHRSARLNVFICMLLLLCGDIERFPGPICQNDITRNSPEMNLLLGKQGIKIFHQNVRGLSSKINQVSVLLQIFRGIDVLLISKVMTSIVHFTIFLATHLLADHERLERVGVWAFIFLKMLLGTAERI